MFIVVSYDIVDDRTRNKISKTMLDFGTRIQYSVFECNLNKAQIKEMVRRLKELLNEEEDSIRIYYLCDQCLKKTDLLGKGELTEDKDIYII